MSEENNFELGKYRPTEEPEEKLLVPGLNFFWRGLVDLTGIEEEIDKYV